VIKPVRYGVMQEWLVMWSLIVRLRKQQRKQLKAPAKVSIDDARKLSTEITMTSWQRITDFSYPRLFVPKNERSLLRTFVPQEQKFQELSFPGPFVPGNFRSRGTKVPWNFRSRVLSFSGTFIPGERKFLGTFVPGTFRSHYPIGLVATLLCVLNYCMFGCDFTLVMLTPLWTSQLTLYVGRAAFAARLSVFDVAITVSLCTKHLR